MYRKWTLATYAFGLVVILLAVARGSPAIVAASVLALAGTMGDLRVSRKRTSRIGSKLLRRTLRRLGGQIVFLIFVLLDIAGFGFALVAPVWLAPWVSINLAAFLVATLSSSEDRRMQRESATAMQRLGRAEQELREAEERRGRQEGEHEALRQKQAEQAERLRKAEQELREAEERRRSEEAEHEAQRQ